MRWEQGIACKASCEHQFQRHIVNFQVGSFTLVRISKWNLVVPHTQNLWDTDEHELLGYI